MRATVCQKHPKPGPLLLCQGTERGDSLRCHSSETRACGRRRSVRRARGAGAYSPRAGERRQLPSAHWFSHQPTDFHDAFGRFGADSSLQALRRVRTSRSPTGPRVLPCPAPCPRGAAPAPSGLPRREGPVSRTRAPGPRAPRPRPAALLPSLPAPLTMLRGSAPPSGRAAPAHGPPPPRGGQFGRELKVLTFPNYRLFQSEE